METLITLLGTFSISLIIQKSYLKEYRFALAGRIAMSTMLVLTATGHFLFTKGMAMMIPFLPFATEIVYVTGLIELIAAIGLLLPKYKKVIGWFLILFFILLLPANIYAASSHIDIQNATYNGEGLDYLWFRIPLQLVIIVWVYWSAVRKS
ncbi:MAG: hypothetical protein BGO88_15245 [Flavobacterium sp. 38-13]|uniref:DoxX family protein n=1 Tax=Flavobacterium sp. 38-13 TaxID=1896168 RepID=UPI0009640988|nr:hypothetical protein [Flavobacterium sp. 38-13]OJX49592.1 MAG: hypothetical protein BGO88_15245 [Flavobacterium sp. 38-13]